MFKSSIFAISLFIVSACGFHLAGQGTLSEELENIHIVTSLSSKDLLRQVERGLRSNNINIVSKEDATAILHILNEQTDKAVLTLDNDGKAREFELMLRITFEVQDMSKNALLTQQVIALNRDFVFDKSDLLGANEEEQALFSEMRNDAVKLMLYRLQTI